MGVAGGHDGAAVSAKQTGNACTGGRQAVWGAGAAHIGEFSLATGCRTAGRAWIRNPTSARSQVLVTNICGHLWRTTTCCCAGGVNMGPRSLLLAACLLALGAGLAAGAVDWEWHYNGRATFYGGQGAPDAAAAAREEFARGAARVRPRVAAADAMHLTLLPTTPRAHTPRGSLDNPRRGEGWRGAQRGVPRLAARAFKARSMRASASAPGQPSCARLLPARPPAELPILLPGRQRRHRLGHRCGARTRVPRPCMPPPAHLHGLHGSRAHPCRPARSPCRLHARGWRVPRHAPWYIPGRMRC